MKKCSDARKNLVYSRNIRIVRLLAIQLPNVAFPEVQSIRKFQILSPKSGRGRLRELAAYKRSPEYSDLPGKIFSSISESCSLMGGGRLRAGDGRTLGEVRLYFPPDSNNRGEK